MVALPLDSTSTNSNLIGSTQQLRIYFPRDISGKFNHIGYCGAYVAALGDVVTRNFDCIYHRGSGNSSGSQSSPGIEFDDLNVSFSKSTGYCQAFKWVCMSRVTFQPINQDLSRFLFFNYSEQSRLDTTDISWFLVRNGNLDKSQRVR